MKQTAFLKIRRTVVLKSLSCILLVFAALNLSAQSLPDFSGVWIEDKNKSDDFYKAFNVTCNISQTEQSITISTTFSDNTGTEMVTRQNTFTLDGKETVDSEGANKSAKWSSDKKTLITSDTKDYGGDLVGVTTAYDISDNGLVLTVTTSDIKPDIKTIIQVFNKENK